MFAIAPVHPWMGHQMTTDDRKRLLLPQFICDRHCGRVAMTTTNAVPESSDASTDPTTPRTPARESQFLSQNPHLQNPNLLDPSLAQSSDMASDMTSDIAADIAAVERPITGIKSGFDGQHPPDKGAIDACVHCGFCLSTCPSYRVLGTEMDSPRGRIYLMDAIAQGEAQLDETTASHFDSCLGCLACTSTCPSGVGYDRLLADMRPQLERNVPRGWGDRLIRGLIFNLFPYPKRLQALLPGLWLYQKSGVQALLRQTGWLDKISPQLAAMESVLPAVSAEMLRVQTPRRIAATGKRRYRVGMVLGCVQRSVLPEVNGATMRVLSALGCEVVIPQEQGCCGALPAHQGQEGQAQAIAKQMIQAFDRVQGDEPLDAIVINAAGCGHTLKEYGEILRDNPDWCDRGAAFSAQVQDIHEFLMTLAADRNLAGELQPITESGESLTVVYQDACHLLHGQKISSPPRELLGQIPGVEVREPVDAALCCGSAGVFNLLQPEIAEDLGEQKVGNLLATEAQVIASPNPGCTLQIQKHLPEDAQVPVYHPIQLLDHALRGEAIALPQGKH